MASMTKLHTALNEQQVLALSLIEKDTDLPRTRILRRAVTDYIKKYSENNPGFIERLGAPIEVEREFKPGLQTDIVVIRGIKKEVIVTTDGWRMPTPDDYVEEGSVVSRMTSILDGQ